MWSQNKQKNRWSWWDTTMGKVLALYIADLESSPEIRCDPSSLLGVSIEHNQMWPKRSKQKSLSVRAHQCFWGANNIFLSWSEYWILGQVIFAMYPFIYSSDLFVHNFMYMLNVNDKKGVERQRRRKRLFSVLLIFLLVLISSFDLWHQGNAIRLWRTCRPTMKTSSRIVVILRSSLWLIACAWKRRWRLVKPISSTW